MENTSVRVAGCEGCDGTGYVWPIMVNLNARRDWVERCDECLTFPTDDAAAGALLADLLDAGFTVPGIGYEFPDRLLSAHPYVDAGRVLRS